jgi:hypothetical protein
VPPAASSAFHAGNFSPLRVEPKCRARRIPSSRTLSTNRPAVANPRVVDRHPGNVDLGAGTPADVFLIAWRRR